MGQSQARPHDTAPTPPPSHQNANYVIVRQFIAQTSDQLTVYEGELVTLERADPDWAYVKTFRNGRIESGWVPAPFLLPREIQHEAFRQHQASPKRQVSLFEEPWYHGRITRVESQRLLESGIAGSFLVRESESVQGGYSISLRANDIVYHYRISTEFDLFFISPSSKFNSLVELVRHHSSQADGLIIPLKFPIPNSHHNQRRNHYARPDQWEIDRQDVRIQHRVGGGQYGDVYKAIVNSLNLTVAVKTLREDNQLSDDFMKEMEIMKQLKHPHLIQLIGVCSRDKPYYLLTEFMTEGCLLDFIRKSDPQQIDHLQQLKFAIQICDAMQYLEQKNFIHRDLAARNCLVTAQTYASPSHSQAQLIVKVADFGLSRLIETNEVYTAKKGGKFPIKWTAPEAIAYNRFSIKSDVWSFGILFWEICSFGMQPYPGVDISNVYEQLENNKRLDRPDNCPRDCYALMKSCWAWDEAERSKFCELFQRLTYIHDRMVNELSVKSTYQQPPPPPTSYKNHPSMRQRPVSTRPQNRQMQNHERPSTAIGFEKPAFDRNEPTRKSGGFIKLLKKSFGKGKHKKDRTKHAAPVSIAAPPSTTSSLSPQRLIAHSPGSSINADSDQHPPDIWLSNSTQQNIAKPIPRKPPRRVRSKSGSCSSPTPSNSVSSNNLPHMGRFNQSDAFQNSNQHRTTIEPRLELENQFSSFNLNNLTPQVPELTPTNSKENIFDCSSEASCDDFASLHSTGNQSKRPKFRPPAAPIRHDMESSSSIGFGSLHGGVSEPEADFGHIFDLQRQLTGSLRQGSVRRSVILQCGQPLCDAFQHQIDYLPAGKKFKFCEKLGQMRSEVARLLSSQASDGRHLATLSTDLVNLLR